MLRGLTSSVRVTGSPWSSSRGIAGTKTFQQEVLAHRWSIGTVVNLLADLEGDKEENTGTLVEGEAPAKSCEVVFQFPQALGVGSKLFRPGALSRSFFLKLCETLFVV
jgi:hypothetical protein